MPTDFDLARFVDAQDPVIAAVGAELDAGRKQTHWMWFVFPQIAGLGRTEIARRFEIASIDEARAYLAHPVLGARLKDLTGRVVGLRDRTAHEIFGSPDDLKFRSSMTLFARAAPQEPIFTEALGRFYADGPDPRTLEILESAAA
jgi:uncharacterized protein (DUF1810 family)